MKKVYSLFLVFCMIFCLFSCGGGGGGGAVNEMFTISYNANGADSGTVPASQHGDEESPQSIQANTGNLAKSGYLFDGWNTDASGSGTDYAPGASYKGKSATLYAKWAAIFNVQVIAPASPAPALNGVQKTPGEPYIKILGLTAKGRTLANINIPSTIDGYQVASIGSGAFQNCDFVAELIIPETVSNIESNAFTGCTSLSTLTIPRSVTSIGDGAFSGCAGLNSLILLTVTPPTMGTGALDGTAATVSVPVDGLDDYKAAGGWSSYSSSIAGYSSETYTVTFDGQGATKAANPTSIAVEPPAVTVGQLPTPPEKSGFGFEGWYMEPEGAGGEFTASTVVTRNITVYAKWNQNYRYTVRFDDQGATTPVGETSVVVGSPNTTVGALPSEPTRDGYVFGGWYTEQNGQGNVFTKDTIISGNITVYANWLGYNISLDGIHNGTVITDKNGSAAAGETVTITVTPDSGYRFGSIAIKDSSSGIVPTVEVSTGKKYTFIMPARDVIVSVVFNKIYTITYNGNGATGGTIPTVQNGIQGEQLPVQANNGNLTKTDYKFGGWNTAVNGTGTDYEAGGSTYTLGAVNVILYAKWIPLYAEKSNLEVGDIVLQNGKYVTYANFIADPETYMTSSTPAGVVAYKGYTATISNVGGGTSTKTIGTLGKVYMVGLSQGSSLGWTITASIAGYNKEFSTSETVGENNWDVIVSTNPTGAADAATNYPAFYYAQTYSVSGYTSGWFLPSVQELSTIAKNKNVINNSITTIIGAGGIAQKLPESSYLWSSSQYPNLTNYAVGVYFGSDNGQFQSKAKNSLLDVLVVRALDD